MPGNGLALTVEVCREVDEIGLGRGLLDRRELLLAIATTS